MTSNLAGDERTAGGWGRKNANFLLPARPGVAAALADQRPHLRAKAKSRPVSVEARLGLFRGTAVRK